MEYKMIDCNSYKIHTIKTDKFKNCSIEVMFRDKLDKNKITSNNFVVDMLMHSSHKYPQRRDVAIALEDLYSASLRGICSRLGNSFLISFVMDFLNPKYCEKGYLDNVIKMLFEMLQNPNVNEDGFDLRSFNIIKNRLRADIESIKEKANRYAFRRSLENMDKDSPSSYSMVGNIEDLESITPNNLIDRYNDILNNYVCDIYVIGNLDMDGIVELIKKKFTNRTIKEQNIELFIDNKIKKKNIDVSESGKYEQDSFIMIYNLIDLNKRERDIVIHLFNVIFGSGSLTSKLYKYIREENSLCYSVNSNYQKFDQLLMIYAGIDKKDKDLCIELVNKALNEMVNGEFSEEELDNAKKTIVSSIKMSEDTLGGIINNYLFNNLDELPLYDERIKEFINVEKQEIMELAKKIKLNTVYMLTGEDK